MKWVARLAALALLGVVTVACGANAGEETRNVLDALERSAQRSRSFSYVDATLDDSQRITVVGRVQDDFVYSGTVNVGGKDVYQMVVSDDAVALRIIDVAYAQRVVDLARTVDVRTADALARGSWVIDHTAAPALRTSGRREEADDEGTDENIGTVAQIPIGDDPFFDAASALEYAERSFRASIVTRFNPEDIEYNPADDPWRSDAERELEDRGVRRFDLIQPPLPQRASRGQQQRLPSLAHFRKMVVYLKGEEALEVQEQVSLTDRREFRRAEVGRTAQYYLKIRDDARRGAIAEPLRERRMVYRVEGFEDVSISLPRTAESGLLKELMGEGGLKALFSLKTIGGGPSVVLPTTSPAPTSPLPSVPPAVAESPSPVPSPA